MAKIELFFKEGFIKNVRDQIAWLESVSEMEICQSIINDLEDYHEAAMQGWLCDHGYMVEKGLRGFIVWDTKDINGHYIRMLTQRAAVREAYNFLTENNTKTGG